MRENTLAILAWITITLTLFAVPALPIVPTAFAVELPPGLTLWRPYGPYAKQVQITVFQNEIAELNAFKRGELDWYDSTITRAELLGVIANPDALVSNPVAEASMFQIDFNHRYPILGVQMQEPAGPCSNDPTHPHYVGLFGTCSSMRPTEAGIEVRRAIAHLIDKAQFVATQADCAGGFCVAIDDPSPGAACTDTAAPCSTFAQRVAWDTPLSGSAYSHSVSCTATPCAYHIAAGGALGAPSAQDLAAAREHLARAGLVDSDGDGKFNFPATGQTVFAIRNDDPSRLWLGTTIANALDSLFETGPGGVPLISRLFVQIAGALGATVFFSVPDADWGLYTGGWGLGLDATHLFPLYDSAFASNFCGGNPSLFNLNYGFYCNNAFDKNVEQASFLARTVHGFNSLSRDGLDVAGKTVMTIPVYSRATRTLVHNGWEGAVEVKTRGFADTFSWFNMRQRSGYVSTGGLGLPGGGDAEVIRAGFRQGTSNLNIFNARTLWDSYILSNILGRAGGFNPRPASGSYYEYEASVTSITEEFNEFGADQIPGNNDDYPVTVVRVVFRNDVLFHDGVQLTARDLLASLLAYRDVCFSQFPCNSLLTGRIPIPNSNCGQLCVELIFDGQSYSHKLEVLRTLILPLHLWDANGDGFICRGGQRSCYSRESDPTTSSDFDPMAAGIMIGHGPWMCLNLATGKPGGSCSITSQGVQGGQSIGPGGRFVLTRYDGYVLCCPTVPGTPLHFFSQADVNKDWKVDIVNDFVLAAGNQTLQALIVSSLDLKLGGLMGKNLNEVDTTNTGNLYPVG